MCVVDTRLHSLVLAPETYLMGLLTDRLLRQM